MALEILGSAFGHHKAKNSIFLGESYRRVHPLLDVAEVRDSSAKRPLGCYNDEEEDHRLRFLQTWYVELSGAVDGWYSHSPLSRRVLLYS